MPPAAGDVRAVERTALADQGGEGPLYSKLAHYLRERILTKELCAGQKLPTEAELGLAFGLSRITVRQALSMLTREGLIERFPSRGSFVSDLGKVGYWELRSINDLVQVGKEMSTEVVSWLIVPPPQSIIELFASPEPVFRLRAVRSHGAVPLYFAENYIRQSIGELIKVDELRHHTVVELLRLKLGMSIGHANEEISIGYANASIARHLWTTPKQPLIVQRIDLFDKNGQAIQCGRGLWRSERFKRRFILADR